MTIQFDGINGEGSFKEPIKKLNQLLSEDSQNFSNGGQKIDLNSGIKIVGEVLQNFSNLTENSLKQPIKKHKSLLDEDFEEESKSKQKQNLGGSSIKVVEAAFQNFSIENIAEKLGTRFANQSRTRMLTTGLQRTYSWISYTSKLPHGVLEIDKAVHEIGQKVDSGAYSDVFACGSGVIKISKVKSDRLKKCQAKFYKFSFSSALKEMKYQKYLIENHVRNICSNFKGHIIGPFQCCIHMPYLGITLRDFYNSSVVTLDLVFIVAKCLLETLSDINKLGIIHCDIKPDNILCSLEPLKLNLIDFGFAQRFDPATGSVECPKNLVLQALSYRAISAILQTPINSNIDLWSLGCVLFEIFTKQYLFKTEVYENIIDQQLHRLANIMALIGSPPQSVIISGEKKDDYFVLCEGFYVPNPELEKMIVYYREKNEKLFSGDFSIESRMKKAATEKALDENDIQFLKLVDLIKQMIAYEHKTPDYYLNFLEEVIVCS